MEPDKSAQNIVYGSRAGETNVDYRERLLRMQAEAEERRRQELHEQSSVQNEPSARIRIWERRHQIELPRSPTHRLIAIIAANTGLSIKEVVAEQRLRSAAPLRTSPPDTDMTPSQEEPIVVVQQASAP